MRKAKRRIEYWYPKQHASTGANRLKRYVLDVSRLKNPEIIDHMEKQHNVQAYLRNLIKTDMKKGTGAVPGPDVTKIPQISVQYVERPQTVEKY